MFGVEDAESCAYFESSFDFRGGSKTALAMGLVRMGFGGGEAVLKEYRVCGDGHYSLGIEFA